MSSRTISSYSVCFILTIALWAGGLLHAQDLRAYFVGNSLTEDSKPIQVKSTLGRNNINVIYGQHIRSGKGLTDIVLEPEDSSVVTLAPFGIWTKGLAENDWDVITLQAYPGGNALEEVAATRQLIETALAGGRNVDCKFLLYFAWPMSSETETFSEQVMSDFRGVDRRVFLNRGFLDYWYTQMTTIFPDLDIRIIPTGLAYASMDQKLREIVVDGYTNSYDFYRDVHHMNNDEGAYIARASMIAAVSGIHPKDQAFSANYLSRIDDDFEKLANDVVWQTLSADIRTGIRPPSEAQFKMNVAATGQEVSFVGLLQSSTSLGGWETIEGATSPYRIPMNQRLRFFRAIAAE